MSGSLVSVIIPTYYRNDQLQDAIKSVQGQEFDNIEIIVVDDSGEGFARKVVEKYDVEHYIELESNKGDNNARNVGISEASGTYFQFLDDDDVLRPTKISKQVGLLESQEEIGVVYCGLEWEDSIELPRPDVKGDILEVALTLDTGSCMHSTMLIEEKVLNEITPLKQRPGATDVGTIIDLAQHTKFDYIIEPLVVIGESSDSQGSSLGAAYGREEIINEYAYLYEQFEPGVKREAVMNMHTFKGMTLLRKRTWSPTATQSFILACYYSFSIKRFMRIFASAFGMPGMRAAHTLYNWIKIGG